jgi:uncharacterized LabA/DUF88 family protein
MTVIGFGEKKTPQPFISACDKFIYLEILKTVNVEPDSITKAKEKPKQKEVPLRKVDGETVRLIVESVNDLADESGWTFLGSLGHHILKKRPDFDPRNYGFQKLLPLIKSINKFEIDERETGQSKIRHIYLKLR